MQNANREVAVRWFEEVWNKGRREAIAEMLLPDAIVHDGAQDGRGPEGFYPFFDRLHSACPDLASQDRTKRSRRTTSVSVFAGRRRWRIRARGSGMPPTVGRRHW